MRVGGSGAPAGSVRRDRRDRRGADLRLELRDGGPDRLAKVEPLPARAHEVVAPSIPAAMRYGRSRRAVTLNTQREY